MPTTMTHDRHYSTCLGNLGNVTQNRTNAICVVSPKVAKESKVGVAVVQKLMTVAPTNFACVYDP